MCPAVSPAMKQGDDRNMDKASPDYVVCLCRNTTRRQVEEAIKETGSKTLKELCAAAKIGDKCGGCREDLEMILREYSE